MQTENKSSKKQVIWRACVLALLVSLWGMGRADARDVTISTPAFTADTLTSEIILKEAYRRIGVNLTIKKLPPERSLQAANKGQVDGEVQRISTISAIYPNLVRVDPTINYLEGMTFALRDIEGIESWADLKDYKIGMLRGIKFVEKNLEGMQAYATKDYETLFRLLEKGRVDVVVTPRFSARFFLISNKLAGVREVGSPLVRLDLFHYLHKQHADLIPALSAQLQEMSDKGELAKIRTHVMASQLQRAQEGLPFCDAEDGCIGLPEDLK